MSYRVLSFGEEREYAMWFILDVTLEQDSFPSVTVTSRSNIASFAAVLKYLLC